MDLSALIFVALAVAWATYLIPKALRHHEDSSASRTVEGFSVRLRVLARREPVDSRSARLVVPGKPAVAVESSVPVDTPVATPVATVPPAVRRAAAARAARRRLRVVLTIVLAGVAVAVAAALGHLSFAWLAVPGVVLVAWLVACRLMVKRERAVAGPTRRLPLITEDPTPATDEGDPATEEIVAVQAEITVEAEMQAGKQAERVAEQEPAADAGPASAGWDPVPVTLPTYVGKEPAARRSVRTIDLDATGVWTSGPLAADSALAREADAERKTRSARAEAEQRRRAAGS
ncbi:hypothetical protein [Nocardioides rubriscoriae]|uniref:divisome protein SepX/GlpR n=1 Tax=Nocardioides rubriscoriae TaxID=642762 RepID=UPI0011DFABFB|nr:hypothetical protein [Nocardioides rubriscoriae]